MAIKITRNKIRSDPIDGLREFSAHCKAGSPAKPKGPDNKMEEREPEVGKIENPANNDPKVDDTPQEPGKALIKGSRLFPTPKRSI